MTNDLGSGKTTLLSIILGHHPRSFSLPASALTLFNKPRRETPTPTLRRLIGHTSPEIYASFPRGMGLSALAAIGSGFEGVFSRRDLTPAQKERILYMLEYFQDLLATGRNGGTNRTTTRDLALRLFAHYTPPQQALLLFLRAMVARYPLVILDEPAQGMDEAIWQRCCEFLEVEWRENPEQAVVVVSHYEDEVCLLLL
jgi:ABC-type molybdenum transport system ATPase subunit/photorepair protein PhrA